MPATVPDLGTGLTAALALSSPYDVYFNNVIDSFSWRGVSRQAIRTSHLGMSANAFHTYMPSRLIEPGEVEIRMFFDPDTRPPIDQAAANLTIEYPSSGRWVASAFLIDHGHETSIDELIMATNRLKISGTITVTDA